MNRFRLAFLTTLLVLAQDAAQAQAASAPVAPSSAPSTAMAPAPSASAPASADKPADKAPEDEVVEVDDKDPAMKAAFKKSQTTLDSFLALAKDKNTKLSTAALRVKVRQGRKVDYLWVTEFSKVGKRFKGSINDAPRHVTNVESGQDWFFSRADIVDWMYIDAKTNVMHGNHTTCALLSKAPAAEVAQMKKEYGLECTK